MLRVRWCKRCEGLGTINPPPFEMLKICPECRGTGGELGPEPRLRYENEDAEELTLP